MYSEMCCTVKFYDTFPTTHVLMFQTDVLMRRRIPPKFFDYHYLGAPWHVPVPVKFRKEASKLHEDMDIVVISEYHPCSIDGLKNVGNGGYSLRNVAEMKRILQKQFALRLNHKVTIHKDTRVNFHH